MKSLRQLYYDLFSNVYDRIIQLHSGDKGGSLRAFIAEKARVMEGNRTLDLCTGTGSVGLELAKQVGKTGMVIGLDFSLGMLEKARQKAAGLNINRFCLVQGDASRLPFKNSSFHGVTCSHAFYELKGPERIDSVREVARILKEGGRFCLMEHARPEKPLLKLLFHIRIFFLGARDARQFLKEGESIFGKGFQNISKEMSPTGQSRLIHAEKKGSEVGDTRRSARKP
jgi:ubiquinone/menaquinone biosynthesis C-methylase UbiE